MSSRATEAEAPDLPPEEEIGRTEAGQKAGTVEVLPPNAESVATTGLPVGPMSSLLRQFQEAGVSGVRGSALLVFEALARTVESTAADHRDTIKLQQDELLNLRERTANAENRAAVLQERLRSLRSVAWSATVFVTIGTAMVFSAFPYFKDYPLQAAAATAVGAIALAAGALLPLRALREK